MSGHKTLKAIGVCNNNNNYRTFIKGSKTLSQRAYKGRDIYEI